MLINFMAARAQMEKEVQNDIQKRWEAEKVPVLLTVDLTRIRRWLGGRGWFMAGFFFGLALGMAIACYILVFLHHLPPR